MDKTHLLYRSRHWLIALWLLVLAAYHAPWIDHDTAAFRLNAFDLAEQVGLHPAIQAESPPYRTAGLLRIAIPMIAAGVAFTGLLYNDIRARWLWRGIGLLIALRVIPPESALRAPATFRDDTYAFQLLFLTLLGVFLVLLSVPHPLRRFFQPRLQILEHLFLWIALILPLMGLNRSIQLLQELGLAIAIGGGAIVYAALLLIIGGVIVWNSRKQYRT